MSPSLTTLRQLLDWRAYPDILLLAVAVYVLYRTLRTMGTWKIALGVVVAHSQIGLELISGKTDGVATRLNDLLYLYLHIGCILLAAGILTGSVWAASSWGRYWGWDPKEVWSLIALLAYMAILHARADRLLGAFGTAAWSIVAFWTILMTYLGVNFILSAGLHSYGFGESSVAGWMFSIALLEVVFLSAGLAIHNRRQALETGSTSTAT